MTAQHTGDSARIRLLIDQQASAFRAKNADGVLAAYAPEAVTFDLAPPLQHSAAGARERIEGWFATWVGPLGYDIHDLAIDSTDDLAFGRALVRISGTKTDGERPDVWARLTLCLRKIEGAWKIVHEHTSVPFYMDGSLRAAVDLKP
jgi:uncharacterized protein (TIGR02246 family)